MENTTKDILNYLENKHTQVATKEDFKGNYYSYITDTIYIAKSFENKNVPPAAKNINKKAAEVVVVCHECIHSVQSKYLHILNTILSNFSMLFAFTYIIVGIFWTSLLWLKIVTAAVITTSIVIRLILETEAVNGSIKLTIAVVEKEIVQGISKQDIDEGAKYVEKYKYLALSQMIVDKIIFLILVLVVK